MTNILYETLNYPQQTQLFVVPEGATEPQRHNEFSDPDHYGTDVETVAVHGLKPTHHVQQEDAYDEPLHNGVANDAQNGGGLLLQVDT